MPERTFEDHENLVEPLLAWTRDSENKILFQERPGRNEVFKNPQVSGQSNRGVTLFFVALVLRDFKPINSDAMTLDQRKIIIFAELLSLEERQESPERNQE